MGRSQGKGKGAKNDGNWKKDSGGGGGRYVTAKQAAFIDTLIEQQDKNEEEKRLSKMKKKIEADIRKDLGVPRAKGSSKRTESCSDLDSDDEEDSDDWSDEDFGMSTRSAQRKFKKMQGKYKKVLKENRELSKKTKEYDDIQHKVTEHLITPPKDGGGKGTTEGEPRLTMFQWMQLRHEVYETHRTKRPRGLFDEEVARESEESGSSGNSPVEVLCNLLDEKLQVADSVTTIKSGVKVSQTTEKAIKAVANSVASKHFAGASETVAKDALEALKTKYSLVTPAKQANTLLLAILRACISRGINFTEEDLLI